MKQTLLLPNRFKTIGWFILIPATIAGILLTATGYEAEWLNAKVLTLFYDEIGIISDVVVGEYGPFGLIEANITNTLVGVVFLLGALMVAFSKEQHEDEFIANLRLSSLLWSVWLNYVLLLIAFLLVYGIAFLHIMIYNMFTILIIFIIRFNYILYRNSKSMADDK
ncbi:MAG TPA: hypothetical protein VLA46_06155 [Saprospiraceae bacterium]|nr:hypothetical protein [Saprospiraceae bacterium]